MGLLDDLFFLSSIKSVVKIDLSMRLTSQESNVHIYLYPKYIIPNIVMFEII